MERSFIERHHPEKQHFGKDGEVAASRSEKECGPSEIEIWPVMTTTSTTFPSRNMQPYVLKNGFLMPSTYQPKVTMLIQQYLHFSPRFSLEIFQVQAPLIRKAFLKIIQATDLTLVV